MFKIISTLSRMYQPMPLDEFDQSLGRIGYIAPMKIQLMKPPTARQLNHYFLKVTQWKDLTSKIKLVREIWTQIYLPVSMESRFDQAKHQLAHLIKVHSSSQDSRDQLHVLYETFLTCFWRIFNEILHSYNQMQSRQSDDKHILKLYLNLKSIKTILES